MTWHQWAGGFFDGDQQAEVSMSMCPWPKQAFKCGDINCGPNWRGMGSSRLALLKICYTWINTFQGKGAGQMLSCTTTLQKTSNYRIDDDDERKNQPSSESHTQKEVFWSNSLEYYPTNLLHPFLISSLASPVYLLIPGILGYQPVFFFLISADMTIFRIKISTDTNFIEYIITPILSS